jgi:hypothetical protein
MRRRPHRIACLLAAVTLALPGAAWGQSAGDEQYEDPFAPEPGQSDGGGSSQDDGGGSSGGGSSGGGGAEQSVPAAQPETAPAPTTVQAAPNGEQQLPRTGADAGLLALGGTLLLASGVALRVRLSEPARRRR